MFKITQALNSRTFWTIAVAIIVNTINANVAFIPAGWMDFINPILGLLATFYHVNPSQNYSVKG